jgi:hypothetical protein
MSKCILIIFGLKSERIYKKTEVNVPFKNCTISSVKASEVLK